MRSTPRGTRIVLAMLAVAAAAASWPAVSAGEEARYDPYRIPRAQFHADIRTIAVRPLVLPRPEPGAADLRGRFGGMLADTLRDLGYQVVEADEYARIWNENARRLGGVFDPFTGKPDDARYKSCYEHTARELARLHGVDAIASANISYKPARVTFEQGYGATQAYALWQPLTWQSKPLKTQWYNPPQLVMASYIGVSIHDLSMTELYNIAFPIEWVEVYWQQTFEERPQPRFDDEERNRQAVRKALEDLRQ